MKNKQKFKYIFLIFGFVICPGFVFASSQALEVQYEYFSELSTDPASLVLMITPQDLIDVEIHGIEAFFHTNEYKLPTPYYSNFNVNFQGWGMGDWNCNIATESLQCFGNTALENKKKTIVALYFENDVTMPDYIKTNILDENKEVADSFNTGSKIKTRLIGDTETAEATKSDGSDNTPQTINLVSAGAQTGTLTLRTAATVAIATAVVLPAAYFVGRKKLPKRKKRRKTNRQCTTCSGSGKVKTFKDVEEIVKCANCKNVPFERCSRCAGTGKSNESIQSAPPASQAEMKFLPPCDWCGGTGFKQGSSLKEMIPAFTGAKCTVCKGRGYTVQKKRVEKEEMCKMCNGKGTIPV
jgi:hypothetical protein